MSRERARGSTNVGAITFAALPGIIALTVLAALLFGLTQARGGQVGHVSGAGGNLQEGKVARAKPARHPLDQGFAGVDSSKPTVDAAEVGQGSGNLSRGACIAIQQFGGGYPFHGTTDAAS